MANQWKKFSTEDMQWMQNHPLMEVCEKGTLLRGKICFTNYAHLEDRKDIKLSGCYEIEMRVSEDDIPYVWETGGYLLSLAKSKDIPLWRMHVLQTEEGSKNVPICLGLGDRIIRKSVESIFDSLIIPYFWFHAYYEKYDEDAWECLKHDVGFLQDYAHNQDIDVFSYIERMPNNEIFRKIVEQYEILENECCLCRDKKISCDCRGMEGFRLLQEGFHCACKESEGPRPRKIGRNDRCSCGVKAKKCTCGEMENRRKQHKNHPHLKTRIEVCKLRANRQNENKETFAKHVPHQNSGSG